MVIAVKASWQRKWKREKPNYTRNKISGIKFYGIMNPHGKFLAPIFVSMHGGHQYRCVQMCLQPFVNHGGYPIFGGLIFSQWRLRSYENCRNYECKKKCGQIFIQSGAFHLGSVWLPASGNGFLFSAWRWKNTQCNRWVMNPQTPDLNNPEAVWDILDA